jgi:hypothetical protein
MTSPTDTLYQAGASMLGMGAGDPLTLTEGVYNSNQSLADPGVDYQALLGDGFRQNVVAYIPITLRPQTTITETTYTYNKFNLLSYQCGGGTGTAAKRQTATKPTAVDVRNPYAIQKFNFAVLVGANYTVTPLQCGDECPDIVPPDPDGTNNSFSNKVTSKVGDVSATTAMDEFLKWFGANWIWIVIVAVLVVVVGLYIFMKIRGGKKSRDEGAPREVRFVELARPPESPPPR